MREGGPGRSTSPPRPTGPPDGAPGWGPARVLAFGWLGLVLVGTLGLPGDPATVPSGPCLVCGSRGTSDVLVNLAMLAPLGVAASAGVLGFRPALLFLLPVAIELGQLLLPGRHPSVGDVLFNVVGLGLGMLGYGAIRTGSDWLWRGGRLWAAGVLLGAVCMSVLQTPMLPDSRYFANWNPDLRTVVPYPGPVISATVDGRLVESGPVPPELGLRHALGRGVPVALVLATAPPEGGGSVEGIFGFWDDARREVMLLGVRDSLAVVRGWDWGRHLRFNHWSPSVPFDPLLDSAPDTLALTLSWSPSVGACVAHGHTSVCEEPLTPADSWTLILSPTSEGMFPWMSFLWLVALFVPLGFVAARRRWGPLLPAIPAVAMALLPSVTVAGSVTALAWLGVALGTALGWGGSRLLR